MLLSPLRLVAGAALLATTALGGPAGAAEAPRVVASILPVHSLVAAVMQGVGTPDLLVKGAGSEHAYQLKPSDARALANANVVFWVDEDMETFLEGPIEALPKGATVVALAETPGLTLRERRAGGIWEKHTHAHEGEAGHDDHDDRGHDHTAKAGDDHDHDHDAKDAHAGHDHDGHDHDEGNTDLHVWLDPTNAIVMTDQIAATLAKADPANAARYQANAAAEKEKLTALDAELKASLASIKDKPYIVFHDAYQYFEKRYALDGQGSITLDPTRQPGADRVKAIHARIQELGAPCVFSEPQFEPRLVQTVIDGTKARTGVLDPLGSDIPAGPDQYPQMMKALSGALTACLAQPS
ncbi:zinc ABC transporter substrate-binding protein [Segnochrobactraceae bacterium EtOH-i3]